MFDSVFNGIFALRYPIGNCLFVIISTPKKKSHLNSVYSHIKIDSQNAPSLALMRKSYRSIPFLSVYKTRNEMQSIDIVNIPEMMEKKNV